MAIDMRIVLEEVDASGNKKSSQIFPVEVVDISMKGIGFIANCTLESHTFYKAHIVFPTKERINVVLETVRTMQQQDGKTFYGSVFVGINESDKFKIEVFRLFTENERMQMNH